MVAIKDLFDLDKTIARELFEGKTYPWEVLDEIKPFILKLGESLDPAEYDQPYEGVWVAKDAKVFPSALHVRNSQSPPHTGRIIRKISRRI